MISKLLKKHTLSSNVRYNNMHPYTNKLSTLFMELEEQSEDGFYELFKMKELKRGTCLLNQGDVSAKCFFIEKGITRSFQVREEREITLFFNFPNEFVNSYQSSILDTPSSVSIQSITDSVIYEFDWLELNKYKLQYPVIWKIEELLVSCLLSAYEGRLVDMQEKNFMELYKELLVNQPKLIQSVPLSYIASYIGCTVESISRIRARLSYVTNSSGNSSL